MSVQKQVFKSLKKSGAALSRVNANNTHSGNLSLRDPEDSDRFFITSRGSQCGSLKDENIVPVYVSKVSGGDVRASSELPIHRAIYKHTDSQAVIHAHPLNTICLSFDSRESQTLLQYLSTDAEGREEFIFQPVDVMGASILGKVRVTSFLQPIGSPEMVERIPQFLKESLVTIVRGHGPFARGKSLEDALHRLDVLEHSAKLALTLKRRGIDLVRLQKKVQVNDLSPWQVASTSQIFEKGHLLPTEKVDQVLVQEFGHWLNYNFNNCIGAFGTGSMSQKVSPEEMIFCPMSSLAESFDFPLVRRSIQFQSGDGLEERLHKLIYQCTDFKTCMITTNPLMTAEGMAVLAEAFGEDILLGGQKSISYSESQFPVILPIDAEGWFLNPKVGVVDLYQLKNLSSTNPILNGLRWFKGCCVIAGFGVISTGLTALEQAAHNASSAERIATFRQSVHLHQQLFNSPPLRSYEARG